MSQILKSLQVVTQSFTGTPSTGTGVIFASGSKMYFENSAGSVFPLGGPGYIRVLEYTGSNPGGGTLTYTWTTPQNIKYIQVVCVGGGGGGGSSYFANTTAARLQGGTGGGGGSIAWGFFDKTMLTQSSYTISVGSGGAGGLGAVWVGATVVGSNGAVGQPTTFGGTMVSASGGGSGSIAASPVPASIGGIVTNNRPGPGFSIAGGSGNTNTQGSNNTTPTSFFSTPLTPIATAAGGNGANDNLGTFGSGSAGASGFEWNTLKSNNTVSSNSGSDNLVTGTVLLQFTSSVPFATTYGLGGGGNGTITPNVNANGGNGGKYGAGGGGAGFASNATTNARGPSGGSGSSGLCIVVEYY